MDLTKGADHLPERASADFSCSCQGDSEEGKFSANSAGTGVFPFRVKVLRIYTHGERAGASVLCSYFPCCGPFFPSKGPYMECKHSNIRKC